jgi:hypothetical protein
VHIAFVDFLLHRLVSGEIVPAAEQRVTVPCENMAKGFGIEKKSLRNGRLGLEKASYVQRPNAFRYAEESEDGAQASGVCPLRLTIEV